MELTLPATTLVTIKNPKGVVLIEDGLVVFNSLLAQSQQGIDMTQQDVWSMAYAEALNQKYGTSLGSTEAYVIALYVSTEMQALKKKLSPTPTSPPSTGSTPTS